MSINLFQIGDEVSMINETISGVVVEIKNDMIIVQSEDGFTYHCESKDIIQKGNLQDFLNDENHQEFLKENSVTLYSSFQKKLSLLFFLNWKES